MTERLFVAVGMPLEARLAIDSWRNGLDIPGKPVPLANFHITLRFIGDADELGKDRLLAALDELDDPRPFNVSIGSVGAFPKAANATVAWAAVEEDGSLSRLARGVDDAVESVGFGYEDRPFHPHLTLSRIRPPRRLAAADSAPRLGVKLKVDHFTLYRSQFEVGRVHYLPIERFPL